MDLPSALKIAYISCESVQSEADWYSVAYAKKLQLAVPYL